MSQKEVSCPVCGCTATNYPDYEHWTTFYECPVCGRFELKYPTGNPNFNRNHLSAYLIYHKFDSQKIDEYRFHTVMDKEYCDKYRKEFEHGNNICGWPVHMDAEVVENWYPKTFSERIDLILLYFGNHISHIGQEMAFSYDDLLGISFVDRWEKDVLTSGDSLSAWTNRENTDCEKELHYILNYLVSCAYITYSSLGMAEGYVSLTISPKGYARIDELQKNTCYGRSVLVAMKFGNETKPLREAIRQGIQDAGYAAVFIDEVPHNNFITPELLKHIRDSKFVVVDLTHQNNGAYFEEGYAMGLGKPVIQLCKKDTKLHFDIAQKNTIIWESEDEIPQRLTNRIKATIE